MNTREELGQTARGQHGFESTGTDKIINNDEINIIEEYEEEYEEEDLEDQPLLKILEEMEQQVILDIKVNEYYTQLKDQQIYHITVEEIKKNTLNKSYFHGKQCDTLFFDFKNKIKCKF